MGGYQRRTGTKSTTSVSVQQEAGANGGRKWSFTRSNTKGHKKRGQSALSNSTQASLADEDEIKPVPQTRPSPTQAQSEISADIYDNLPIIELRPQDVFQTKSENGRRPNHVNTIFSIHYGRKISAGPPPQR